MEIRTSRRTPLRRHSPPRRNSGRRDHARPVRLLSLVRRRRDGLVYFGSGDTNVYALDAANGTLKWKFKTGDVVHASPALADGKLFVGSWDSYFYALDATTGKEKSGASRPAKIRKFTIRSAFSLPRRSRTVSCTSAAAIPIFYALDAATGKERWRFNNKGSWVIGSPAVRDDKVYFATSDTALFYALDAKTGAANFFAELQRLAALLFPGDRRRSPLRRLTRRQALRRRSPVAKARLDVRDGRLEEKWRPPTPNPTARQTTNSLSPTFFYDDMVSGVQKFATVGAVLSSPVVAGDTVYFGSTDGNVYALI